jgi:hypothetical protein
VPYKKPQVDNPVPKPEGPEIASPTSFDTNKYAPKDKLGKPTVGVPNRVERIGLGGLKTITNYGNQSDV